ncbi:MAG: ferredoxin [Candidatus Sungbacteria bacterium]|uniref:Ferredoxin n=1 Tax=Candidatus Sungiibacteriota bacterium TaxID=2750080 RepID=A0A932YW11_9BACT|nr:ferredoxin [Candidatus Sungbacteria bacterium]
MENQGQEKKPRIGKLMVDRNLCIGAASCIAVAPSAFELDPENKAVLRRKSQPPTSDMTARKELEDQTIDDEMLLLAAKSCPTQAIIVYDEEGRQIYP